MKLILTTEVENLGSAGDAVEVKDGYGRNYLLPRGFAIVATRGAQRQADAIRRSQELKSVKSLDHANELKAAIEELGAIELAVKAAPGTGKLFGSVTAANVVAAIKKARSEGKIINPTKGSKLRDKYEAAQQTSSTALSPEEFDKRRQKQQGDLRRHI